MFTSESPRVHIVPHGHCAVDTGWLSKRTLTTPPAHPPQERHAALCWLSKSEGVKTSSGPGNTHNLFLVLDSEKLVWKHGKICISSWYKKFLKICAIKQISFLERNRWFFLILFRYYSNFNIWDLLIYFWDRVLAGLELAMYTRLPG